MAMHFIAIASAAGTCTAHLDTDPRLGTRGRAAIRSVFGK